MNKKIIVFILVGVFLISLTSAIICGNQVDTSDVPCIAITGVLTCSTNITVTHVDSSNMSNVSISAVGDGTYNFTFNFGEGNYSLVACDNSSAVVTVGDFPRDDLWKTALMIGLITLSFTLIIAGQTIFENDNWILKSFLYLSGFFVIIITVDTGLILSKVDNINTLMVTSLVLVITTISILMLYLLIYYTKGIIRALREVKQERNSDI